MSTIRQIDLLDIPDGPVVYWVSGRFVELLKLARTQVPKVEAKTGIVTGEDERFLRAHWEVTQNIDDWSVYAKGGGYKKWRGFENWMMRWPWSHAPIKQKSVGRPKDETYFMESGWNYALMSGRGLSFRQLDQGWLYNNNSPVIFPLSKSLFYEIGAVLQTRLASYVLRLLSQSLAVNAYYVTLMPYPEQLSDFVLRYGSTSCVDLKLRLISSDLTEYFFGHKRSIEHGLLPCRQQELIATWLHFLEMVLEIRTHQLYSLNGREIAELLADTGPPAGYHALIAGYDALPDLPADLDLPPLPQEVVGYLAAHERIAPPVDLARIKVRLRALYEAGPGVKENEDVVESDAGGEDDEGEGAVSGAHIPIPTETFLEELSVKMQLHPISVYWLLEELRAEGVRCKPDEQRLLEDRLSVLVLRLLGHRWPKQIEAGEPVPGWADPDGIIPIIPGAGETTMAERLRTRLRAEDGDIGVQRTEALLVELAGLTLEEWVRRRFFGRHVRQFKYRPVAWHLASSPSAAGKGRKRSRQQPAFECMLYYHACGVDVLARIRTQYIDPLLRAERQRADDARRANDETAAALATEHIQELEAFAAKLRQVADEGFGCPELDKLLENEPLDRWSGDGYLNDGVRVNIAPLQLAGLLASDVLKAADAKKAIADRARWRSDERRWVRAGKLPRCGWMDEHAPESQAWMELAPQREAERAKLEEKRRAALGTV